MNDSVFGSDKKYLNDALRRYSRTCTIISRLCNGTMSILLTLYAYPLVDSKPLFTYVEVENKYAKYGVFLFQWMAMSVTGLHTVGMDTLLFGLMGLTAAYLEAVNNKLIDLKNHAEAKTKDNDFDDEEIDRIICKELKKCVIYHIKIIE